MLTALLIFLPLIFSVLVLWLKPTLGKFFAFFGSLAVLLISLVIVFKFDKTQGNQFGVDWAWITSVGINFSVGIDGISLLLVLLTTVLMPGIILSSMNDSSKPSSYYSLMLLMQ